MKKFLLSLFAIFGILPTFAQTWEKTDAVAVGDIVVMTYDNGTVFKEMTSVDKIGSNSVGIASDFETTPSASFTLTLVAGSQEGSFAFQISEATYLAWASGNTLTTSNEIDDASSWTLTYANDHWDIYNVGTTARKLQYNATSPRFACYGNSNQQPVDLWKQTTAATIAKPTLPSSTTFFGSMEVAITAEDGLEIHYTTDGTDPTIASSIYTGALTITETTTVKAIAANGTGASSAVASATYTKLPSYATIEALTALENNAAFVFTGEALIVAKPTAKHVYISDQTGACLVYDASGEKTANAEVGKTIAANWAGKVSIYNKLFELVPNEAIAVKDGDPIAVTYPTVTAADIIAENVNKVVTLKNVTSYGVTTGKNMSIMVGETEVVGYNQFGLEIVEAEEGKTYEIVGVISRYNDNIQFQPIEIKEAAEPSDDLIVNADLSSTEGWTPVLSGEYREVGNGLIGSYVVYDGKPAATVDDTHLDTEYCFGFECRWQTNFAAYSQETAELAPGFYTLQYDVENVNEATTAAAYENRFTVTVGENVYTDKKTEWMNGKSAWTTHTITFEITEAGTAVISLGYGTGSNNIGSAGTPVLYVSHLSLYADKEPEPEPDPYEDALAAIGDGGTYFITTNVEGTTYYVTKEGKLTSTRADGCIFTLTKTDGGAFKTYGYYIDGGGTRFTNAPLSNNQAVLNVANFSTTTNNRQTWEAQVLFLQDGKYAIRATNAASATSSWGDAGRVFFTWKVDDVAVPQYTYDEVYQWNLEAATPITVSYQLTESDGTPVGEPVTKKQEAYSEVSIPSSLNGLDFNGGWTPYAYYDYNVEETIGDTDCTIKVVRTPANGVVHALTDLSNEKAYTIMCDRGALLTNGETIASTSHATLHAAEPGEFAVISYEDNYYIYSVADKKFVLNTGSLSELPTHGIYDAIQMSAQTDPYFLFTYKIDETTTYGVNTNGTGALNGCVINNWVTPDPGDQYYMIESADFDATAALAALEAYFHPSFFVTYVVKDAAGNPLFTSDPVPTTSGAQITTLPTEYQRAFTTYNEVDVTISEEETTVEFTATTTFPFELSSSFADAKWYNMTIRSDYWVAMDETEPYYPKNDKDLSAPASQWAFGGDVYNGILIYNKAAGEGWTLAKAENNVVMREGDYGWEIFANSDGFVLREPGTDNNWINQNGGASGPLQFWNSGNGKTDNGSTFRVTEVVEEVLTPGDADGDGSVDVLDHAVIRNYILDNDVPAYVKKYDVNEDQDINVADLAAVVNIILGLPIGNDEAAGVRSTSADVLTLNNVGNGRYALQLQSGRTFTALQMDLVLPAGMTLLSEESANHEVMTRSLSNGKTRILVYSMQNAAFDGTDILYFNVAGQGTITAENIFLSDANANSVRMTLGNATGINAIGMGSDATIYDLSGRQSETLRRGVNIVRKADGTTKKLLK